MASSTISSRLSPLQHRVLEEFFRRERGFWLTGGAALAGFHLGHRTTSDLDLFTLDDAAFERGRHVIADLASAVDLRMEITQDAPGMRRYALTSDTDGVVVDLVRERVAQGATQKEDHGGILVDPAGEVLANKLTTLVGRSEERDLIDVMFLERAGYRVEDAMADASRKDGGCTPATLAWLLSQLRIPDGLELPAQTSSTQLREFVDELVVRLRRLAAPGP